MVDRNCVGLPTRHDRLLLFGVTDKGQTLIDSILIVEWLDWKFPDKGPRLLPDDIDLRYKFRVWTGVYD